MRIATIGIILALVLFERPAAEARITVGPVRVIVSADRFKALHLPIFPDGSVFELREGGPVSFFAAQGGPRTSPQAGTIELNAAFAPVWTDRTGGPIPSLRPGFLEPAPGANAGGFPFGATFDRDYAGGGPTFRDYESHALIEIYHGEYHAAYPAGQPFYTSLGIARSIDGGRHFEKLGLAIRPEIPPNQPIPPQTVAPTVPSSSGTLVARGDYFYSYYSDLSPDGTCAGLTSELRDVPCIAVARAKIRDVIGAARRRTVAPWWKYESGRFTQPGIGGRFTPLIVTLGATWARWPMVIYDDRHKRFFMTDVLVRAGAPATTTVELRESPDGLHWSGALAIASATAPQELNYPSLGSTGGAAIDVFFVREHDAAKLGEPYTRDVDGVTVRLDT